MYTFFFREHERRCVLKFIFRLRASCVLYFCSADERMEEKALKCVTVVFYAFADARLDTVGCKILISKFNMRFFRDRATCH